jgi:DNA-binding HxlR family transcriptional regulator
VQRQIVILLAEARKPMQVRQLGAALEITSPTLLVTHLKALEAAGRVTRGPKGVQLVATPKRRQKGAKRE